MSILTTNSGKYQTPSGRKRKTPEDTSETFSDPHDHDVAAIVIISSKRMISPNPFGMG